MSDYAKPSHCTITCPICAESQVLENEPTTEAYCCAECDSELNITVTETKITIEAQFPE